MIPMFRLDHKIALVTGAARGLGAATARMLAKQGALVAAADIDFDEVKKATAEVGNGSKPYFVDVSNLADITSLIDRVAGDLGRIDDSLHIGRNFQLTGLDQLGDGLVDRYRGAGHA